MSKIKLREPAKGDFSVEVEGLGTIVCARRTNRDRFRIGAEYQRLTEGAPVGVSDFGVVAEATATFKVLLVDGPAPLLAALDMDAEVDANEDTDAVLIRCFLALREKELSFRRGTGNDSEASGSGEL